MRKVYLFFDHWFIKYGQRVGSSHNYSYDYLRRRYLSEFDELTIIGRVRHESAGTTTPFSCSHHRMGPGVRLLAVPGWGSLRSFAQTRAVVWRGIARADREGATILFVAPGVLASMAALGPIQRRCYGVELVGDAQEAFETSAERGSGSTRVMGYALGGLTRRLVKNATAVAYVSKSALATRYPPNPTAYVTEYSSIHLDQAAFTRPRNHLKPFGDPVRLLFVGSLERSYKGLDTLLAAMSILMNESDYGLYPRYLLTIAGGGRLLSRYRQEAEDLSLTGVVRFVGRVQAGEPIRHLMRTSDLLVVPSRTEGLPRVILEADALALPVIATAVGGVPELLPKEYLVPPDAPNQLADLISEVTRDGGRAIRGFAAGRPSCAMSYRADVLQKRRDKFYAQLREQA